VTAVGGDRLDRLRESSAVMPKDDVAINGAGAADLGCQLDPIANSFVEEGMAGTSRPRDATAIVPSILPS
jgi:hypothetical protein